MRYQTKVTARIIAEQLGLSMATVDRALNNRGNVKEETYQKIWDRAKELEYKPNKLASYLSRRKQYSIAVIYPEYPRYFWEQIKLGVDKAYNELEDYGLNVQIIPISDRDFSERAKFVKGVIHSKEFDGIALAAGEDIFIDVVDEAIDVGVPICTFNHDLPASKRLFYVGCDYRNAGRLAGELLCKFIGESGSILLLTSSDRVFQHKEKITGFREILKEYPNVEILGPVKLNRENLSASLTDLKEDISKSNGIYVTNPTLTDVARFLTEQEGHPSQRAIVGHDINQDILDYLNRDIITATICQDPINQGYYSVKKLFEYITDKSSLNDINTKLEIVLKENAKFYI